MGTEILPPLEPKFRSLLEWSPESRRAAVAMADAGSMRLAADLCEVMLGDDRVAGCLGTRIRGLLGLKLRFEGAGDGRRRTPVARTLEEGLFWKIFPESTLLELMVWGILLGIGVARITWEQVDGAMLPALRVWHPRWLRFDWVTRRWLVQTESGEELVVTPGDGTWVLYTPYGEHRPWTRGVWRPLSLAWICKHFNVHDWSRHNEVKGSPIPVGVAPVGAVQDDWTQFAKDIANLGARSSIALPPGYDLKFAEAPGRVFETFEKQIGWADTAIAIALHGQNLTTHVTSGSLAAAKIHDLVRHDLVRADGETLSTTLRAQVLVWWAEFNFGDSRLAPWPQWATEPPADLSARAESWLKTADAVSRWIALGVAVDVALVAQQLGVPVVEDKEGNEA